MVVLGTRLGSSHAPGQVRRQPSSEPGEADLTIYRLFNDAEENLGRFIGDVYNAKRLHSSLGYLPPIEFEHDYFL